MAFTSPMTAVTGATFTAAQFNTNVRDNLNAIWVGTSAGDVEYYSSSSAKARLAKPSVDALLKNTSSGVPSWMTIPNIPGLLHAKAFVEYDAGDHEIDSVAPTYASVTNAVVDIVITVTCTVFLFASGVFSTNAAGNRGLVRAIIGGVAQTTGYQHTSSAYYVPFGFCHYRAGVTAGTITCRVQGAGNASGNHAIFSTGKLVAIAIPE